MKKQFIIILFFMGICLVSHAQIVIDNPEITSRNTHTIDINKIELLEDATVLYMTAVYPSHLWVKMSSKSVLKDPKTSRTYKLLKCEGFPIDTEYFMPDGRQEFKMYFEPLSSDVSKFDFFEGYENGAFRLYGVVIRNTIVLDSAEPTINVVASPGETIIIPVKTLRKLRRHDVVIRVTER